jgi:hypothetical protein
MQIGTERHLPRARTKHLRFVLLRACAILLVSAVAALTGCGHGLAAGSSVNSTFSVTLGSALADARAADTAAIDTNCTGCNSVDARGSAVEQFSATLGGGGAAPVIWSVSGGDATSGPGTISETGQYTPPSYLTEDSVQVEITAVLDSDSSIRATSILRITPGFLQPLTPENVALGANGTVNVTGFVSEAGGDTSIHFEVTGSPAGNVLGIGTLGETICKRDSQAFTACTVTYTAPAVVPATGATYVVARAGNTSSRTSMRILLNTAGVTSNPATHQAQQSGSVQLGSSGGNNNDYDLARNQIVDCCSGTLGSLLKGSDNKKYLLSNNHVLARSDHAGVGDPIIQPGLIDNNCRPGQEGSGPAPVATLSGWPALKSASTNVDAAIAQVASDAVDQSGNILEMGVRQIDGTLAAAPPGISSTSGRGEAAALQLKVAKSGRTTGETCASVAALDFDVNVDYYQDCAETVPYLSKTFTNQIAISGDGFSDAGDSGSLVLDSGNAEPVGLYFAGGIDISGVSQAIASPATEVLNELDSQVGNGVTYTFVGTQDHQVSCLNYGDGTVAAAQTRTLADAEIVRAQQAVEPARGLAKNSPGILGVAAGKSSDHPGEAAVIVYVDENEQATVPLTVGGVRTMVIATSTQAVALGSAPSANTTAPPALPAAVFNAAAAVKLQYASALMKQNPSFFGVGVGQSLDNPKDAALVVFVDRRNLPAQLPQSIGGLRTRYVVMDRLHVTRSYAAPLASRLHCRPHPVADESFGLDVLKKAIPPSLLLY